MKPDCKNTIVVTDHHYLIDYLTELKLIDETAEWIQYPEIGDIYDARVIGELPLYLAAATSSYTEVRVLVPKYLKNETLSLEQIRLYAMQPRTYSIKLEDD